MFKKKYEYGIGFAECEVLLYPIVTDLSEITCYQENVVNNSIHYAIIVFMDEYCSCFAL